MEIKKGIPASPGVYIGRAFVLDSEEYRIPERHIKPEQVSGEISRLQKALAISVKELQGLYRKLARRVGKETSAIVDAYIKMMQDEYLKKQIVEHIRHSRFTAEYAVSRTLKKYAKALHATDDTFFSNRVQDIYDIERRLLKNLLQKRREDLSELKENVVVIARDLRPTQTITLDRERVRGFATDSGGETSHTAIIARSMGIPAVVGLNAISLSVSGGDMIIIDGNTGIVIIEPDDETIRKYTALEKTFDIFEKKLLREGHHQAVKTKDDYEVQLYANIELPYEVPLALKYGATGIGLLRTEFLYSAKNRLPTEKEHFDIYKKVVTQMGHREVIIRTLDLGADKLSLKGFGNERNPFLGCRAIRLCYQNKDIFTSQIRAVLRAAKFGNISIMIPMISSIEEIRWFKNLIMQVSEGLSNRGVPFSKNVRLGIMIEVPSAAMISDILIKEVDFFSIGTNDLIQYTIAVDRANEKVARLYQPAHPAVLRLIKLSIDAGIQNHKTVGMCGEMSGNHLYTLLLLGMGLKLFSVVPVIIPEIKKIIRSVTIKEAQTIAHEALSFHDAHETVDFLREHTRRIIPELY